MQKGPITGGERAPGCSASAAGGGDKGCIVAGSNEAFLNGQNMNIYEGKGFRDDTSSCRDKALWKFSLSSPYYKAISKTLRPGGHGVHNSNALGASSLPNSFKDKLVAGNHKFTGRNKNVSNRVPLKSNLASIIDALTIENGE